GYTASHSVVSQSPQPQSTFVQQLEFGKIVERSISGGQVHSFLIEGQTNQFLNLIVAQQGIDVVLAFYEPDGTKLGEIDQTEFGPETMIGVMGPPGQYRLEVRPVVKSASAGRYQIVINELRAVRDEDKAQISARSAAFVAAAEGGELLDNGDAASLNAAIEKYQTALNLFRQANDKYWQAFTLTYNLGVTYRLLYKKQLALDTHNQGLEIFRRLNDRSGEAGALSNIGNVYNSLSESLSDKRKAVDYYNQALAILKEIGDATNQGALLSNTGLLFKSLGEFKSALDYYNQALVIQQANADTNGEAVTLLNLGAAYQEWGDQLKALDYFNRALPILKVAGDRGSEAGALRSIGYAYEALGDPQKAIEFYERALPLARSAPDLSGEALILGRLGSAYGSLSRVAEALNYYNQSLQIRKQIGDRRGQALILLELAHIAAAYIDQQQALDYYRQALALFTEIADRDNAETTVLIGNIYAALGEKRKAMEFYDRALPIIRAKGGPVLEAQTLEKIGAAYNELSEREKSLSYFNQALAIFQATGNSQWEAQTLNNIGSVYDALGELQKSLNSYEQALGLFKKISDRRGEAVTLNNLGSVYSSLEEEKKALDYYLQAWRLHQAIGNRSGEATMLNNIGLSYLEFDHPKQALEFFDLALSIERLLGDRSGEATTLDNLGTLYNSLNEPQKALDSYYHSLALRRTLEDRNGEANTLSNLSGFWWEKNARLAVFYGKLSVNVYQQLRGDIAGLDKDIQKSFLRSVDDNHRLLSDMLIAQDRLPEAQQVLNFFKDQQFFDFNRDIQRKPSLLTLTPHETLVVERYEQIADRLRVGGRQLSELKLQIGGRQPSADQAAQLQGFETQLKKASDELFGFGQQLEADFKQPTSKDKVEGLADTRELQAALRELKQQTGQSAVAIYTLAGPKNLHALIVSPDHISSVSQPAKRGAVDEKALQLWGLLQSDQYDPRPLAEDLYSVVFKPIESQLPKGTTTILWSLDGNLRYLPMGALYDGKQYLVERYNHAVFTRADSERLTRAVSPRWTGLGLGSSEAHTVEVLGDKISFDALPGVTEELRQLFRQKNSPSGVLEGEVLPDAKFTKAAMFAALKQKRPLVHISSHFSFRPGDEARSFLLLGDGTTMTLEEMKQHLGLFNGVELLTLSACNTAAQQEGNGREIDGFAELAQRLGAASVMATLWPVADNSTPWLMREFYQSRQSGQGLSKAEAFRRAQLALLNGTAETKPLPAGHKGAAPPIRIVIGETVGNRDGRGRGADVVYVDAENAPRFVRDAKKPFAHPYYWAPFILIGNWK
ncbi:MAG: tetratricopeptide repeat protein, partial [Acidobacteriota bacterium]|nr:tetratricopeptide repeat protein [Acidobacteriota bacterium]